MMLIKEYNSAFFLNRIDTRIALLLIDSMRLAGTVVRSAVTTYNRE